MSVIDVASGSVTATIPVGFTPGGVAFSPDGTKAYVTSTDGGTVSVIDVDVLAVLAAPSALPTSTVGSAFSFTLPVSAGTPAATFSVSAGALPAGLSLDPATGIISGTPTTSGPFSFTINALNAAGTASATYAGTVVATTAPASLPVTGTDIAMPLLLAALALALGGSVVMLSRRTSRKRSSIA
jgi:LPXTG-motif cell wall-anchored protein